jgi:predicted nucleic acid-binding protein
MVREADVSVFIDSNIVLCALGDDEDKRVIAAGLLADWPTISTQVISECTHVLRRKLKMPSDQVAEDLQHGQLINERLTVLNPFMAPVPK